MSSAFRHSRKVTEAEKGGEVNNYKINAPYSAKGGNEYVKIEIQAYKYLRAREITERVGKMRSIRIDAKRKDMPNIQRLIEKALSGNLTPKGAIRG